MSQSELEHLSQVFAALEAEMRSAAASDNFATLKLSEEKLATRAGQAFYKLVREGFAADSWLCVVVAAAGFDFKAQKPEDAAARWMWDRACSIFAKKFPEIVNDPCTLSNRLTDQWFRYNKLLYEQTDGDTAWPDVPLPLEDADKIAILRSYLEDYAAAAGIGRELAESLMDSPRESLAQAAPEGWLTVSEAARRTGIPDTTLSKACSRGQLKHVGRKRNRRIDPKDLERFKEEYRPR